MATCLMDHKILTALRLIYLVSISLSFFLLSEEQNPTKLSASMKIEKIILFARPSDNNQLSQFVELQKHELPAFLQFKYKKLDDVESAINWMISGNFRTESLIKLFFASVLLSGHESLPDEVNEELDSLREKTVSNILSQDPYGKFVSRLLQNIAFNNDDPRFDQFKIFPTWLIEVYTSDLGVTPNSEKRKTGYIILEGFSANLLDFIDLKNKTLDGEKLNDYLTVKKGFF